MPDTSSTTYKIDSASFEEEKQTALRKWKEQLAYEEYRQHEDKINFYHTLGFIVVVGAVLVFGIYKVLRQKGGNGYFVRREKWWDKRYYDDRSEDEKYYYEYVPEEPEPASSPKANYLAYTGSNLGFSRQDIMGMLQKHYPYYCNLNPIHKGRFVDRLQEFMDDRTFIIHAKEGYKEMPVLLSAAAIQLTFGLEKYMLPNYRYINIHLEEYFAENSFRVLAGNVQGDSITIAWNQFLKGLKNPTDGVNVGLHEMAHAVYYQHVIVDTKREKDFCNCFNEVMEEGAEVYELKTTQHVLFTANAFKDLQEFWAESVELFFEKPFDLKNHFPELFDAISELLKQNPCNGSNPVNL